MINVYVTLFNLIFEKGVFNTYVYYTFCLLYAGETVLFASNYQDMQNLLNVFDSYCTKWKLTVNCKKTLKF